MSTGSSDYGESNGKENGRRTGNLAFHSCRTPLSEVDLLLALRSAVDLRV